MKVEELLRCQIHEWYPTFAPHTFKTILLPLPPSFLHYLLDDDSPFLLPSSSPPSSPSASPLPSFPSLHAQVAAAVSALGGPAFPKLNWSAPKDAAPLAPSSSLACRSLPDVALLLKSSDAVSHDLHLALSSCSDLPSPPPPVAFHLALRRFHARLRPDMEFRCFVRGRRLVAVSQREVTTFYPALPALRSEIGPLISFFCEEVVLPGFASEDFTFDVYVVKGRRVMLVDFNPWGAYTLPLLFEWGELEGRGEGDGVEFRVVESRLGVRPGLKTVVPYDYVDTAEGSGWDVVIRRIQEEMMRQAAEDRDAE